MTRTVNTYAFYAYVITRIIESRIGHGLTRPQLARAAGMPSQMVDRWEYGLQRPELHSVQRLARALGVPWTMFYPDPAVWLPGSWL